MNIGPGGATLFWAGPQGQMIHRQTPLENETAIFSRSEGVIRLEASVNETAACQIVMRAETGHARVNAVEVDPLQSDSGQTIPSESIQVYRADWIATGEAPSWHLRLTDELRQPSDIADPLVPLDAPSGGMPIRLSSDQNEILWLDIHVPPGASPGRYTSRLRLNGGGGEPATAMLQLDVHESSLPAAHNLPAIAEVNTQRLFRQHLRAGGRPFAPIRLLRTDPRYDEAIQLIDATARMLRAHRCDPVLTDVVPIRRIGPRGSLSLDWEDYDRIVTGMIEGEIYDSKEPSPLWPLPINRDEPPAERYGGLRSPEFQTMLAEYLARCMEHFRERGWANRQYAMLPAPSGSMTRPYALVEQWASAIRDRDASIRLACTLTPYSMERFGWRNDGYQPIGSLVSIWLPPARYTDAGALLAQAEGGALWLNPSEPPYSGCLSTFASPQDIRSLAWMAYRWGAEAVALGEVNPDVPERASDHGSAPLIWPGRPYGLTAPVPSMRLKRLRQGLQDYEHLWALEANGRPAVARQLATNLCPGGGSASYGEHYLDGVAGGWMQEREAWQLAERLLRREVVSALHPEVATPPSADEVLQDRLEWTRLMDTARRVRTQIEGVRWRIDESDPEAPAGIEVITTLMNGTGRAVNGRLSLDGLTENAGASKSIQGFPPGQTRREVLQTQMTGLPGALHGATPFELLLTGDGFRSEAVPGRLCVIVPQQLERELSFDGALDDWPLGVNNVAGDFLLVGAQSSPKRDLPDPRRPTLPTTMFIARDATHLYLGFRCTDDESGKRVISRSNTVQYDGLWPTGEDLLEVILDPTGGALSPGDLYHIVLKANGAVVTEKGFPCLATVAPRSDWPVRVEARVDDRGESNAWTAEMRIPLSAFEEPAAVWGLNVGRYQARLGEYSSWSGAPRHLYSPSSLGNMRFDP